MPCVVAVLEHGTCVSAAVPLPDDGVDDTMDDVGSEGVRIGSMAVGKAGSSGSPPGVIKIDSLHHPDDIAESNAA